MGLQNIIGVLSARILLLVTLFIVMPSTAIAGARIALVIGNSQYQNASSLPNPTNDADDLAQKLGQMGFEVNKLKNLGFNDMRLALREFSAKASGADIALIFYAGHGMEVNKHNYLIPTDAVLASDRDVNYEAVPLEMLTDATSGARHLSLVLLDACRNNPFATTMKRTLGTRAVGRGLAAVEPTRGTLVSFAAKEGSVASDGRGRNSPYTKSLLKNMSAPGVDIQFMFRKVRDDVLESTNGSQEPFTYGSLPGRQIFLIDPANVTPSQPKQTPVATDEAALVYAQIKGSKDIETLEIFVQSYPNSIYAKFIAAQIKRLRGKIAMQAPIKKNPPPVAKSPPKKKQKLPVLKLNKAGLRSASAVLNACDRLAADGNDRSNHTDYSVSIANLKKNSRAAIKACETAVRDFPSDAAANYQLGRSYGAARKFVSAQRAFLRGAELGSVPSMRNLGEYFQKGLDDKSIVQSLHWYEKAAKRGDRNSMHSLGVIHLVGKEVTQSDKVAGDWFSRAADKGHPTSTYNLGVLYLRGRGVPQDDKEALRLFNKAAKLGDKGGYFNAGLMYKMGRGTSKDIYKAALLFEGGANRGSKSAMYHLAVLYSSGEGVLNRDAKKAAELIYRSLRKKYKFSLKQMVEKSSKWSVDFRMELQRKLQIEGFYDGDIDGAFGPGTIKAIRKAAGQS